MAQYVEGPYIVEDQPDGTRKVVGYSGQQATPQSNTLITKQANPVEQQGDVLKNQLTQVQIQKAIDELQKGDKPNLPTGWRWKDGVVSGEAELIPGLPQPKGVGPAPDPQRAQQIASILKVIEDARAKANDFLAVGKFAGNAAEYPVIGGLLGQNRATLEGMTDSIMGDIIQQQIARLSANNNGNGVSSLANNVKEGERIAASIANLSLDQDLPTFLSGLQRAEDYYKRQLQELPDTPQNKSIRDAIARGQRDDGATMRTGDNGFDKYVTDEDRARTATLQRAYDGGASISELNSLATQLGLQPFADADLKAMIDARASGQPLAISPNATGVRSDAQRLLGNVATSNYGAATIAGTNALTGGFLDEIVGATQGERAGQMAQYAKEYARNENPIPSLIGDVVGGIAIGGPLGIGIRQAGLRGTGALANALAGNATRAGITAGTVQGAVTGAGEMNDNRLLGATVGGVSGLAGGYGGGKLANALATSPKVTAARNAVTNLVGRGRTLPQIPQLTQGQQAIVGAVGNRGQQVIDNLQEAATLGVPMTLADADPALRGLAGTTIRRSPEARSIAEQSLMPRVQGQYDRLLGAINRDLGPTANVPQYSDDLIKQAQAQSRPLYEQAFSAPGASSVDVSGIAATPMGQQAFRNAYNSARNTLGPDGKPLDPTALGFDVAQETNEVLLNRVPSFETLDYVKKGLDDIIDGGFDPITKQYTPDARAAIGLKQRLVSQIDNVNPPYAQARQAYAGPAGEREALRAGQQSLNTTPDQLAFNIKDMPQPRLEQFKLGYRSGMVDQAGRVRTASNPWNTVYGSPQAQQRVATLFPEGAANFNRQAALEAELARTNNFILGNSMTAERQLADDAFGSNIAGDMAIDAVTTGTPIKTSLSLLARMKGDELGRIGATRKANEIAPYLFVPDAADAAKFYTETAKKAAKGKRAKGMFGSRKGRYGAISGAAALSGATLGLAE